MGAYISREQYMQMYAIIGAALDVHNELGRGMAEPIYHEALEIELKMRDIPFETEKVLHTYYKGVKMNKIYEADLYSNGVMIELKAVAGLLPEHRAQLLNYMRITRTNRGLLINFGEKSLRVERYIYNDESRDFVLLNEQNKDKYIID